MPRRTVGLLAALIALSVPALAQASITATVRVEGQNATLLPAKTVTLPETGTFQTNDGQTCALNSVAGAIDAAVGPTGWDRNAFTSTILGESHTFAANDYWAEWLNEKYGGGICTDLVGQGDRVLMLVDVSDPSFNPTVFPLAITDAPASVPAGQAFTVTVTEYRTSGAPGTSIPTPAQGVTVTAGGYSAVTGADGKAQLALPAASYSLIASRGTAGRSAPRTVVATAPAGAAPATSPPSEAPAPAPEPAPEPAPAPSGPSPQTPPAPRDLRAPVSTITGIEDGQRFSRGEGPRDLLGEAVDPSGIAWVKLRIVRRVGERCSWYNAARERFVRSPCGEIRSSRYFRVSKARAWSYLLPDRLARGRYVLDVKAADRAGNVGVARERGVNRVVFRVR